MTDGLLGNVAEGEKLLGSIDINSISWKFRGKSSTDL